MREGSRDARGSSAEEIQENNSVAEVAAEAPAEGTEVVEEVPVLVGSGSRKYGGLPIYRKTGEYISGWSAGRLYTPENAGRSGSVDSRLGVLAEMDKLLRPDNFSQFLSEDGSHLTEDGQFIFDNLHQSWQNLLEYVDDNVRPLSYRHQDAAILQRTDPAAFLLVQNNSADLAHLGDSLLALVSWCAKLGGEAIARVAASSPGAGLPPAFVVDFVEKLAKRFAPMEDEQRDVFGLPVPELLFRLNPAQRTFFTSNADDNRAFFRFSASIVVVLSLGGKRGPPGRWDEAGRWEIDEAGRWDEDLQPGAGLVDAILKSGLWQEQDLSGGEGARGEPGSGGRGEPWRVLMKKIVRLLGETMLQDSDESVLDMPLAHRAAGALGWVGRELVRRSRISGRSERAKSAAEGGGSSLLCSTSAVRGGEAPAVHGEDQLDVLRRGLHALLPRESADLLQFVLTTLKQPLFKGWGLWSASNLALLASEIPNITDRARAKQTWELAPLVEAFGSIGSVILHVAGGLSSLEDRGEDGRAEGEGNIGEEEYEQWRQEWRWGIVATRVVLGNIGEEDYENGKNKLTLSHQLGLRDGEGRPGWETEELELRRSALGICGVTAEEEDAQPLFLRALEDGVELRSYCGMKANWYWGDGYLALVQSREGEILREEEIWTQGGPVVMFGAQEWSRDPREDWEDED